MNNLYHKLLVKWHASGFSEKLKKKRFLFLYDLIRKNNPGNGKIKLLDVGCESGKDFLYFLNNNPDFELYGMDLHDQDFKVPGFEFIKGDAEKINFPDKYFDVVVSMGVLEHIEPIEKLCRVISEIDRVSRSYYIIVPAISTVLEPHTGSLFWQLKKTGSKKPFPQLNYYSDEAWLQFEGFAGAKSKRRFYIPLLKQDLLIYKPKNK